jgi:signal peptidase II
MILAACVGCDQRSKYLAREHLLGREGVSLLADTLRLDYTENQGGFLELGESLPAPWRAAVLTAPAPPGLRLWFYILLALRACYLQIVGLSLICGGGIGNLIDRWAYGYARDFLNVGIGSVRTGIFNVADVALMAGCLVVLLAKRRRTSSKPCSGITDLGVS